MTPLCRTLLAFGLASLLLIPVSGAIAAEKTSIKFILNWRYEGPQGYFFLAQDKGWFEEYGIDVTFDQGSGSAAAVTQIGGGAYDAGFGDVNALIQFKSENPDFDMKAVQMHYYVTPFIIASLKEKNITTPKDLEGKVLGAPANDAVFRMFSTFANRAGIDGSNIEWQHMDPGLRQQMLVRGDVDAVSGYYITVKFGFRAMGFDPDRANYLFFGDYGLDSYSNGIIFSERLIKEKPEVVSNFLCAIEKAVYYFSDNIDEGVDAVLKREPLLDREQETLKAKETFNHLIFSPEIEKVGFGNVDAERLERSIDAVAEAFELARVPAPNEVFTDEFLRGGDECRP